MGRFAYTVQDSKGETSSGALEANDENEAISALQGKGFFILSLTTDKTSQLAGSKIGSSAGGASPGSC